MKEKYMKEALIEAKKALDIGEVPVGAVIVFENKIISRAHNKKEMSKNPLLHAELIAIDKACKKLGDWRLNDCELYTTLFPCPMCASAIQQSRIKKIYYILDSRDSEMLEISNLILNRRSNVVQTEKINIENNLLSLFFKKVREK